MKLLTKEIKKTLPALYAQEGVEDKVVHVKYFLPGGRYTLYVTEGEPKGEFMFYGYCVSNLGDDCDEWGYTTLADLESIGRIERDLYFTPCRISSLKAKGVL